MLTLEQEYYARVCERDAEWNVYCHCPTDTTWARYVEACDAVKAAEQNMHWTGGGCPACQDNRLDGELCPICESVLHPASQ